MHAMLGWHQLRAATIGGRLLAGGKLLQWPSRRRRTRPQRAAKVEIVGDEDAGQLVFGVQSLDEEKTASAVLPSRSPVGSSARRSLGLVTRAGEADTLLSPPLSSPE